LKKIHKHLTIKEKKPTIKTGTCNAIAKSSNTPIHKIKDVKKGQFKIKYFIVNKLKRGNQVIFLTRIDIHFIVFNLVERMSIYNK
jgi:hypothetical protein